MASSEIGMEQRDQMIGEKRREMRWKFIGEHRRASMASRGPPGGEGAVRAKPLVFLALR